VTGLLGLHGGGEYIDGDEAAMDALVRAAAPAGAADRPVRVVLLPTAAARQRPDMAADHGRSAFEASGRRLGVVLEMEVALVVDRETAASETEIAKLEAADLVHMPGGDPDLIPTVLRGSAAWAAMHAAWSRGALIAGASAGAMALCDHVWTPRGPIEGLGLLPDAVVVPHFSPSGMTAWRRSLAQIARPSTTWIGLDERTAILGMPGEDEWHVVGQAAVHIAFGDGRPESFTAGSTMSLGRPKPSRDGP
jgi:cyanophycinase-like exopeptidase